MQTWDFPVTISDGREALVMVIFHIQAQGSTFICKKRLLQEQKKTTSAHQDRPWDIELKAG